MKAIIQTANLLKFAMGSTVPLTGPVKATWNVTYRCNSRCKHCERWKFPKSNNELNYEEGINLLEQLKENNVIQISFSGGEPFIRKDIFDLIKYAKKLNFSTSVNTNGLLINKVLAGKIVDSGLDSIYISLDSTSPQIHDEIRGIKGALEKTIDAVKLLTEERKKSNLKIFANTTCTKQNLSDIVNIAKLAKEYDLDGLVIQPVHSSEKMGFDIKKEEEFGQSEIELFNEQLKELENEFKFLLPHGKKFYKTFKTFLETPEELYKYRCIAGYDIVVISPTGKVFTCPLEFQEMGDIRKNSFKEIWFSEKANKFREEIKNDAHPICCFNCVMPFNIIAHHIHPLRFYKIFDKRLLTHIFDKL